MTATQVEAPSGLQWLQSTIGDLRSQLEELRKQNTRLGMRLASLEGADKFRQKENEELKEQLSSAEEQLDESSAAMRAAVRGDLTDDLDILARRDLALANVLSLLAARTMGADALERLGLPADQVAIVRAMVAAARPAPVETPFMDGNGIRFTHPPVTAQPSVQPSRNRMVFTNIPADQIEAQVRTDEAEVRARGGHGILPRRAYG